MLEDRNNTPGVVNPVFTTNYVMHVFHIGGICNTTNVKNMHPHRDSNPGPWITVKFEKKCMKGQPCIKTPFYYINQIYERMRLYTNVQKTNLNHQQMFINILVFGREILRSDSD